MNAQIYALISLVVGLAASAAAFRLSLVLESLTKRFARLQEHNRRLWVDVSKELQQWSEDRDDLRSELNRCTVQLAELNSSVHGGPKVVHLAAPSVQPVCVERDCIELVDRHGGRCAAHGGAS